VCVRESGACERVTVHEGQPCEAADRCATAGVCQVGVCVPSAFLPCPDDGNPCTDEVCDPETGACSGVPVAAGEPCDDGSACTRVDRCDGLGACVGFDPVVCDDGVPCTEDLCLPASGACVFPTSAAGSPCDDGNPCTEGDVCLQGGCQPGGRIASCCRDAADCPLPGPCQQATCSEVGWCEALPVVPCCGNGLVEVDGGEECEQGSQVDYAPGACGSDCRYQTFALSGPAGGDVAHVALGAGLPGEVLAAWTWRPEGQADWRLQVRRLDEWGRALAPVTEWDVGEPAQAVPIKAAAWPVQVEEGSAASVALDLPFIAWRGNGPEVDVVLQQAWEAGYLDPLGSWLEGDGCSPTDVPDTEQVPQGVPFAAGVVEGLGGALIGAPVLWFAAPAAPSTGDEPSRQTIVLTRHRLDSASLALLHPNWVGLGDDEGYDVLDWLPGGPGQSRDGLWAEHPVLTHLGTGLALAFNLLDRRQAEAPTNHVMVMPLGEWGISTEWDSSPALLGASAYPQPNPFPPACRRR